MCDFNWLIYFKIFFWPILFNNFLEILSWKMFIFSNKADRTVVFSNKTDRTVVFSNKADRTVVFSNKTDRTVVFSNKTDRTVVFSNKADRTVVFSNIADRIVVFSNKTDRTVVFSNIADRTVVFLLCSVSKIYAYEYDPVRNKIQENTERFTNCTFILLCNIVHILRLITWLNLRITIT